MLGSLISAKYWGGFRASVVAALEVPVLSLKIPVVEPVIQTVGPAFPLLARRLIVEPPLRVGDNKN